MAINNPLSAENVLDTAAKALGDDLPKLQTAYEAVALIGHACMIAVDFRLVGLGEEHNLGKLEACLISPTLLPGKDCWTNLGADLFKIHPLARRLCLKNGTPAPTMPSDMPTFNPLCNTS